MPVCRSLHQGALAMLIPRSVRLYSTAQPGDEAAGHEAAQSGPDLEQMKELFDEYDVDSSGEISKDELYQIVERVIGSHTSSMHIVDKIMEDCDKDGDENITFEEFKEGMKSYMEFFLQS